MGRKRKGRAVDGWLVVDKPTGIGSTAIVSKSRWRLGAQKAGHAGTLDPLATGVLAVAFGEATKTVPIAQDGLKTYRFTIRLGQATASDDAETPVIARSDTRPSDAEIRDALPAFEGETLQVPPQFSAVKVAGARAYDLARQGEAPELAARALWVERLRLLSRPDRDHVELELTCGKGGYVRAIARDLGQTLGCLGHVIQLRRIASGGFTLAEAVPYEALEEVHATGGACPALLPVAAGLRGLTEVPVTKAQATALRQGQAAHCTLAGLGYGDRCWASENGQPVALCTYRAGQIHPDRVIHPPA